MTDATLGVQPEALSILSHVHDGAAGALNASGSVDSAAMMSAAAITVGPIGAIYLAAYGPAQASNLASTLLTAVLHGGISAATEASKSGYVKTDENLNL